MRNHKYLFLRLNSSSKYASSKILRGNSFVWFAFMYKCFDCFRDNTHCTSTNTILAVYDVRQFIRLPVTISILVTTGSAGGISAEKSGLELGP